jgi:putative transcriptional regulator
MKNKVKIERAIANLTQAELAEKVNVSRQTINALELGKYIPSTVLSLKISKVFGKTVNEIFELDTTD